MASHLHNPQKKKGKGGEKTRKEGWGGRKGGGGKKRGR